MKASRNKGNRKNKKSKGSKKNSKLQKKEREIGERFVKFFQEDKITPKDLQKQEDKS